ncbi:uncharacterized protein RCO7_08444 [Rhynchosporium graminicola]|uniref:Negative acting factor n=1 Tax=Rhynchosporium graminicola TaxID=2792576 RepID=A0A1E1L7B4_9HELO|nr:uncharacterized protein RCO7_08444 [Rhynchosporium commune]
MKRQCTGYRDESDLIFRHINPKSTKQRAKSIETPEPNVRSQNNTCGPYYNYEQLTADPSRALLFPEEDRRLCYFYQTTMDNLVISDHVQYLHSQLPILMSRSRHDSVLQLAARAISYAAWGRSHGNNDEVDLTARMHYSRALLALAASIRDSIEAKKDETLYAALLLEGYETTAFNQEALPAWGTHVDGVTALIKNRGRENFNGPMSCMMFLFARRSAILSQIQSSTPIDPIFEQNGDALLPYENYGDRLLSRTMRITKIQDRTNRLLAQENLKIHVDTFSELKKDAKDLDEEFAAWAVQTPTHFTYSAITNIGILSEDWIEGSVYVPQEIHRYPNNYVTRIWNLYRVSRLILSSIIHLISQTQNTDSASSNVKIDGINQAMVDGICASIPFLLGYDCFDLKHATVLKPGSLWPQASSGIPPQAIDSGKFSLIWPLYVASSVPTTSDSQRRWLLDQLNWIADTGQIHAKVLKGCGFYKDKAKISSTIQIPRSANIFEKTDFVTSGRYGLRPQTSVELESSPLDLNKSRLHGDRMILCFPLPTDADNGLV